MRTHVSHHKEIHSKNQFLLHLFSITGKRTGTLEHKHSSPWWSCIHFLHSSVTVSRISPTMNSEQDSTTARREALRLSERKEAIEAEMDDIYESLTQNNGPGLQGNLVDHEGFPRADIDVHNVREQRNRFARLKTDHKQLSEQLERLLRIALAPSDSHENPTPAPEQNAPNGAAPATSSISLPTSSSSPTPIPTPTSTPQLPELTNGPNGTAVANGHQQNQTQPPQARQPFALVDQVAPSSPSSDAGLQVNDRIVAIGAVSLRSSSTPTQAMSLLPGLLSQHENRSVDVVVMRSVDSQSQTVNLQLTPRRWAGHGLLGCHIVPLEVSQVDPYYAPEVATAAANRAYPIN